MPTHCSALNCRSRDTPECRKSGITFHRLPTDLNKKLQWCRNIGRTDIDGNLWIPKSKSYLCSKHFNSCLFHIKGSRKLLGAGSVPTKFDFTSKTPKNKIKTGADVQNSIVMADKKAGVIKNTSSCCRIKKQKIRGTDAKHESCTSEDYTSENEDNNMDNFDSSLNFKSDSRSTSKYQLRKRHKSTPLLNENLSNKQKLDVDSEFAESEESFSSDYGSDDEIDKLILGSALKKISEEENSNVIPSDYVKVEVKEEEDYFEEDLTLELLGELHRHFLHNDSDDSSSDPFSKNKNKLLQLRQLICKNRCELRSLEDKRNSLDSEIIKLKRTLIRTVNFL